MSLEAEVEARKAETIRKFRESLERHGAFDLAHKARKSAIAVSSLTAMLNLWIPRMEKLDHPKNAQTAREMRDYLKDLEKILNG